LQHQFSFAGVELESHRCWQIIGEGDRFDAGTLHGLVCGHHRPFAETVYAAAPRMLGAGAFTADV
jgi:hypothetical protein